MYSASVLRTTANPKIPQAEWGRVRVYLPESQKRAIVRARAYEHARSFARQRVYSEDLAAMSSRSVMLFRPSMMAELEKTGCLEGAGLIYSLWPGYLKDETQKPFLDWLERLSIPLSICHTSGHASPADLKRLVEALAPRSVVPIHSEVPERYAELWGRAHPRVDGEWWAVSLRNQTALSVANQRKRRPLLASLPACLVLPQSTLGVVEYSGLPRMPVGVETTPRSGLGQRAEEAALLEKFKAGGLGNVTQSWVGKGANLPVSGDQIKAVLGFDAVSGIAAKLGVSTDAAASKVAGVLPQVIDKLTPDGIVPDPQALSQKLTGLLRR